ncbi:MAG: type II toxin-antitoxin system VapC family toxin [Lentisphaerales bacterium]|nr:type II toxin-antitoxin system VapC family toxin [Lentisphaerales bacterium]
MKLLLDTHAFIWWCSSPNKLSPLALKSIKDKSNDIFLSVASIWEMAIKVRLGKLSLGDDLELFCKQHCQGSHFQILPIQLEHASQVHQLPLHHEDPFDRMLISQAQKEDPILISCDQYFQAYDKLNLIW